MIGEERGLGEGRSGHIHDFFRDALMEDPDPRLDTPDRFWGGSGYGNMPRKRNICERRGI